MILNPTEHGLWSFLPFLRGQRRALLAAALLCLWSSAEAQARDPKWATPITVEGVDNFFQISPDLYRAAQIKDEAVPRLAKEPYGIRTVLSLRFWHDDVRLLSPGALTLSGIHYDRIRSTAGHPEEEDVVTFLGIVTTAPKPILIHCQHGADRTGFMSAIYRIVIQGWTKKDALDELFNGEYGANKLLGQATKRFIDHLDVAAVKRKAGLH